MDSPSSVLSLLSVSRPGKRSRTSRRVYPWNQPGCNKALEEAEGDDDAARNHSKPNHQTTICVGAFADPLISIPPPSDTFSETTMPILLVQQSLETGILREFADLDSDLTPKNSPCICDWIDPLPRFSEAWLHDTCHRNMGTPSSS